MSTSTVEQRLLSGSGACSWRTEEFATRDMHAWGNQGTFGEQSGRASFHRGKEELGGRGLEQKLIQEGNESYRR